MSTLQVTTIHSQRAIETFVWKYGNLNFGTLEVPRGYLAETQNYTEGVVTRLCYPDQSCFVLQRGFMYRIPMFQDLDDIMDFSKESKEKTIRRGHYKGKSEVWGEVNYRNHKSKHPGQSILETIGPNLGYEHVSRERVQEFERALESFRLPQ